MHGRSRSSALGKLDAPTDLASAIERSGFEPLPISIDHGIAAGRLSPHHSDPFDRILIAQGAAEPLVIVTKDPAFSDYGVTLLDARS
ncbi:MAG TPA: type II toxin-antitoxin system VapC family toxin [Acidobacteriaceae bacterium]|nr:type II toxin-antitoxin system VapC family toxin [Acidobacteriaceae bacterium]